MGQDLVDKLVSLGNQIEHPGNGSFGLSPAKDKTPPAALQVPPAAQAPEAIQIGKCNTLPTVEAGIDIDNVTGAKPFKDWSAMMAQNERIEINSIHVQSLDAKVDGAPDVCYLKLKADAQVDGTKVPCIFSMRGSETAVLVVLKRENARYTLMIRQPRVSVCASSMPEILAGLLDDDGNFSGG